MHPPEIDWYERHYERDLPDKMQQLLDHREELFERVKESRRQTKHGTFRYPERLNWWEQAHPEHLGSEYEFIRRFDRNVERGIRVVTKVEWLSPMEEIEYQPKVINRYGKEEDAPWYKTLSSSPGSVPENPLLAITVKPVLGDVMPYAKYRIPGEHWHASVAFYWELGPNIYDKGHLMDHLIAKFHNKFHTLRHDPSDSGWQKWKDEETGEVSEGQATVISLDKKRDPIASDMWLNWAKKRGRYHDRDWHVSL
jgi:hypothetical protein